MFKQVSPGQPILPALTAAWYNKSIKEPPKSPPPSRKDGRHHNEDMATFIPSEEYPVVERFCPVGIVEKTDTIGNYASRTQFVSLDNITPYNWVIAQATMKEGMLSQPCVYSGITWAKVEIRSESDRFVNLNTTTLELESDAVGKGIILLPGDEYSLISIEGFHTTPALFFTPSGGIPGRSGTTLGTANCNRVYKVGTTITTSSIPYPVANLSTEDVGGSKYIQALWVDDGWLANWEQCD